MLSNYASLLERDIQNVQKSYFNTLELLRKSNLEEKMTSIALIKCNMAVCHIY